MTEESHRPSGSGDGAAPAVEVAVLGPVVVRVDGSPVRISPGHQHTVLVMLGLSAPEAVRTDELIDLVWGERAPATARTALHNTISRLRTRLGSGGEVIVTEPDGYRLLLGAGAVDSARFTASLERARRLVEAGDDTGAAEAYRTALGLWRGAPLHAMTDTDALRGRLESVVEEHSAATEEWADVELRLGHPGRTLGALRALADREPLREATRVRLVRALHAAGRSADALEEYARTRALLVEELGSEPGPALREAHRVVLAQGLEEDEGEGESPGRRLEVVVPAQLPDVAAAAVRGRAPDLDRLDAHLAEALARTEGATTLALCGPGGAGKTTLAVRWARSVVADFPDGQLFVNLRGFDPEGSPHTTHGVLAGFLTALGVAAGDVPADLDETVGLYRSLLSNRRVLILLDNARDAAQLRPLLPAGPGCVALVTSRNDLSALSVTHHLRSLRLDLLDPAAARELLVDGLGADRVGADPAALAEILAVCGGLPLALAVVVAHLAGRPGLPLADLADLLRSAPSPLDVLHLDDPAADVRAVLSSSVQALSDPDRELFALLGLHPGPDITAASVGSMSATGAAAARTGLVRLATANLAQETGSGQVGLHDLIRAYAAELAAVVPGGAAAVGRLVEHYLHSAVAATRQHFASELPFTLTDPSPGVVPETFTDTTTAAAWLDLHLSTLVRVVELSAGTQGLHTQAWQLARTLNGYLWDRCAWYAMLRIHEAARDACVAAGDALGTADARHGLGDTRLGMGEYELAHAELDAALTTFTELGDLGARSDVLTTIARAYESQDRRTEALEATRAALAGYESVGDLSGVAVSLNNEAWLCHLMGDLETALSSAVASLETYRRVGDRTGESYALDTLGRVHLSRGEYDRALALMGQCVQVSVELGQRRNLALTLESLGDAYELTGDPDAARTAWSAALVVADEMGLEAAAGLELKLAGQAC